MKLGRLGFCPASNRHQYDAGGDGHVREIEDARAEAAEADADEVHDRTAVDHTVDQVSHRSTSQQRQPQRARRRAVGAKKSGLGRV